MLEPRADLPAPPDRLAVIADVHGNADALAAVLAEIAAEGLDGIVNLGDHLSGPFDPGATAELLMARPEMICLRGNHDRTLIDSPPEAVDASDRVSLLALGEAALGWLRALPATARLGTEIFACHGQPSVDDDYLMERIGDGRVESRSGAEVSRLVAPVKAPLVLCAHSHLQRQMRAGAQVVVNPGSVGRPAHARALPDAQAAQDGGPQACWAVLERAGAGWDVNFRRTAYDPRRMAEKARALGFDDWADNVETGWQRG